MFAAPANSVGSGRVLLSHRPLNPLQGFSYWPVLRKILCRALLFAHVECAQLARYIYIHVKNCSSRVVYKHS